MLRARRLLGCSGPPHIYFRTRSKGSPVEFEYHQGEIVRARQHISFGKRKLRKLLGRLYELDRQCGQASESLRRENRRADISDIVLSGQVKDSILLVAQTWSHEARCAREKRLQAWSDKIKEEDSYTGR